LAARGDGADGFADIPGAGVFGGDIVFGDDMAFGGMVLGGIVFGDDMAFEGMVLGGIVFGGIADCDIGAGIIGCPA
jgi:hypothetical protein